MLLLKYDYFSMKSLQCFLVNHNSLSKKNTEKNFQISQKKS